MSDRSLRELEQRAGSDPRACLELAHALERVGRTVDALAALWRGCDDLQVRRAAARFDCRRAPVRGAPSLLWQTKVDQRDTLYTLEAHPLALVMRTSKRTVVLDPRTGEQRPWALPPGEVGFVDEVLLVLQGDGTLVGADAWTGEELFGASLPPRPRAALLGDGLVVLCDGDEVIAHRFTDPRRPPVEAWRWRCDLMPCAGGCARAGEPVLLRFVDVGPPSRQVLVALDRERGVERFRLSPADVQIADAELVVVESMTGLGDLHGHDAAGRRLWSLPGAGPRRAVGLTAAHVIVHELPEEDPDDDARLVLVDRGTGEPAASFPTDLFTDRAVGGVAFALGAESGDDVAAQALDDGRPLWSWRASLKRAGSSRALAFLPGRVFVPVASRHVACLVEADGAPAPPARKKAKVLRTKKAAKRRR